MTKPVRLRVRRSVGRWWTPTLVIEVGFGGAGYADYEDGTYWRDADADNPEEVAFVVEKLEKAQASE